MIISFLDFLFPRRCVECGALGSYVCRKCIKGIKIIPSPICPVCGKQAVGGKTHPGCLKVWGLDGLVAACRYEAVAKKLVRKLKYKQVKDVGKVIGDILASRIWKFELPPEVILVPVPLHSSRKRERGFNQAKFIARDLGRRFSVRIENSLSRSRKTQSQVKLSRTGRIANVRGAFKVTSNVQIRGKNIVLVDDVYTSGATMNECAKVLKKAGAKSVWGMVLCWG